MNTLLLLRHAKSSWDDPSLADFERPLAQRGKRDAPRMGEALKERGPLPDLVISSPATRAMQTLEAFAASAKLTASAQFDERVYGAASAELMSLIHELPGSSSCVLLVGHNPGFVDLVARLSGSDSVSMPTAALACIEFQIERWKDVENGQGKLVWLLTPKLLKN